jgi:hypothetical protein
VALSNGLGISNIQASGAGEIVLSFAGSNVVLNLLTSQRDLSSNCVLGILDLVRQSVLLQHFSVEAGGNLRFTQNSLIV